MWSKRAGLALVVAGILGSVPRPAAAAGDVIFRLTDPRGDDHGSGALVYPLRDDLKPGDLDLVALTARENPEGTLFEATFAQPIAPPPRRPIDELGQTMDRVARLGFYTFNLDIYIDTDRAPGSGHLALLPGRKGEVDPSTAWEKAICLTPRPATAHDMMEDFLTGYARRDLKARTGRVEKAELDTLKKGIERDLDARIFFPTVVRVEGSTISFIVPPSFLGGRAKGDWSYVVAVTAANVDPRSSPTAQLGLTEGPADNLMVVPIGSTPAANRFGGAPEEDDFATPLVDVIVPPGASQEIILKDYDPAKNRPVRLPGVVPAAAR